MRFFIFTLVFSVVVIFMLVIGAFVFLEKISHRNFYYVFEENGSIVGYSDIDEYTTDANIMYKGFISFPYEMRMDRSDIKVMIDRKLGILKEYSESLESGKVLEKYRLKNTANGMFYLNLAKSKFSFFEGKELKPNTLFFGEKNIVSWLALIKFYNFKKGGAQFFNTLVVDKKGLPPYRAVVSLAQTRDEYITVDGKKIKSSVLDVKEKGGVILKLWVSKNDKKLLKAEMPKSNTRLMLTDRQVDINLNDFADSKGDCIERYISFPVNEKEYAQGVLTKPLKRGVYPAVILIPGEEAIDENNFGLFSDMAHYLAEKGYIVLRLNMNKASDRPIIEARSIIQTIALIDAAVSYLTEYRFVDINKISLVGHAHSNYFIPKYLKDYKKIRTWIMIAPLRLVPVVNTDSSQIKAYVEKVKKIDPDYESVLFNSMDRTLRIVEESRAVDSKNIMGEKVYLEKMREILAMNFIDELKSISIPILVINGGSDACFDENFSSLVQKEMMSGSGQNRIIMQIKKYNHYFGDLISTRASKKHYRVDNEFLATVYNWLNKNIE